MVQSEEDAQANKFVPKERLLKNLENELKAAIPTDQKITPDSCTTTMDGYFGCTICLMVVEQPMECLECNQLCCKDCISKWR